MVMRAGDISGIDIGGRDVVDVDDGSKDVGKPVDVDKYDVIKHVDKGGEDAVDHVGECPNLQAKNRDLPKM